MHPNFFKFQVRKTFLFMKEVSCSARLHLFANIQHNIQNNNTNIVKFYLFLKNELFDEYTVQKNSAYLK